MPYEFSLRENFHLPPDAIISVHLSSVCPFPLENREREREKVREREKAKEREREREREKKRERGIEKDAAVH